MRFVDNLLDALIGEATTLWSALTYNHPSQAARLGTGVSALAGRDL